MKSCYLQQHGCQNFIYFLQIIPPASVSFSSSYNGYMHIFTHSVHIHKTPMGNRQYSSEQKNAGLGSAFTKLVHTVDDLNN